MRTRSDSPQLATTPTKPLTTEPAGDVGLYERIPAWKRWERDKSSRGARCRRWLLGRERVPIPSYTRLIEDPPGRSERVKTGICCSGGGIRSAAFNLGALQHLQAAGRLQSASYLAAVSGGAYIAAAFSMVAKTSESGGSESDDSDRRLVTDAKPPFYPGSPEEQYLRNRSSYMAPGGLGRARFVLRVALGLLVNLAFLTAGLVLVAWALAVFYRSFHEPLQAAAGSAAGGTSTVELGVAGGVALIAVLLGIGSMFLGSEADNARRALETLTICGLAIAASLLVVTLALPELVAALRNLDAVPDPNEVTTSQGRSVAAAAGGSIAMLLGTVIAELRSHVSLKGANEAATWFSKLSAPLQRVGSRVAAWVVGPLLLSSILVVALLAMVGARHIDGWIILFVAVVFAVFWLFSDVTSWSLHPYYRRRLCTAFALKRVPRPGETNDKYGMAVERRYDQLVPLSQSGVRPGPGQAKAWPTLVVCAAANISDPGATPPGRSVTSFTFSPVAMGGPLIGGVRTAAFEDRMRPRRRRDFTLAAAVAMSGAALSPSMGKKTRPSIRLLLGLANVRLGVWVPNPRRSSRWLKTAKPARSDRKLVKACKGAAVTTALGDEGAAPTDRYRRSLSAPRPGPWYLLKEMLGWNSVNDPYLYVTDGGHYENLGLVELLRRGCTEIFCFDASGGERLDALGDAIALARSELGVKIDELDVSPLKENGERIAQHCCVTGAITYATGETGVLIYARAVVTDCAPFDVQAFRMRDEQFPHHSTFDQLYTDEKFEAYRALGAHAGSAALTAAAEGSGDAFEEAA